MRGSPLYPFAATAVLGVLAVFVLSLVGLNVAPDEAAENGENNNNAEEVDSDDPLELGEAMYEAECLSCHGGDFEGGTGPALDGYSEDEILQAIEEGPGSMPADLVTGEEADAVAEYIVTETE
ncbi:c-type cytochrome [Alkalicoccus chagannorensis]|uniref:c-type cytochrome n=1 Tax=Alkalicoccus chagannorensis TaxID=427072 RepID=UPI00041E2DDF|nr:cytochrome c [Alkalicoccus chagannorensis]